MLKEIKFVQGAVAKKDYVPALTFFRIGNGRIQGFNGVLELSAPCDLDFEAMPKAVPFVKAIERLPDSDSIVFNVTQAGRLSIKSGRFRAYVECWDEKQPYPEFELKGDIVPLAGDLIPVLKDVAPFMAVDASRPWAKGVLLKGNSAFATNNIVVLQRWLPDMYFPDPINIPDVAIKEILRIGENPEGVQIQENRITFHYTNGAYISTQLNSVEWPETIEQILGMPAEYAPFPETFFDDVERLGALATDEERVYLDGSIIATSPHENEGALMEVEGLDAKGCYNIKQLLALRNVAAECDLTLNPKPVMFRGPMTRGAMVGMAMSRNAV